MDIGSFCRWLLSNGKASDRIVDLKVLRELLNLFSTIMKTSHTALLILFSTAAWAWIISAYILPFVHERYMGTFFGLRATSLRTFSSESIGV